MEHVSNSCLREEIKRRRVQGLRSQSQRNGLTGSLSTVDEYHNSKLKHDRRGSAPELDNTRRLSLNKKSSQTQTEWGNCSLSIDQEKPYDMARHLLQREGTLSHRQPLSTNKPQWVESTITMEGTTSTTCTLNGPFRKFKVILLGDCGVGKSSFLQTFLNGKYTEPMPNTNLTTANAVRTVMYNGLEVQLNFFDTAGQERYRSLTTSYYRHAQGCLMFFNVNYKQTFEHVELWLDDLTRYCKRDNLAVLLVGLMHKRAPRQQQDNEDISYEKLVSSITESYSMRSWSDLDNGSQRSNKRAVPKAQAEHLASNCSIPYIEVDIQNDPGAVLRTINKLLDLLMHRVIQDVEVSLPLPIIAHNDNNEHRSGCCN